MTPLRCHIPTARALGALTDSEIIRFVTTNDLHDAELSDFIFIETHEGVRLAWWIDEELQIETALVRRMMAEGWPA